MRKHLNLLTSEGLNESLPHKRKRPGVVVVVGVSLFASMKVFRISGRDATPPSQECTQVGCLNESLPHKRKRHLHSVFGVDVGSGLNESLPHKRKRLGDVLKRVRG